MKANIDSINVSNYCQLYGVIQGEEIALSKTTLNQTPSVKQLLNHFIDVRYSCTSTIRILFQKYFDTVRNVLL